MSAPASLLPGLVSHRLNRLLPALALLVITAALGYRLFTLIRTYSVNALFFDEWDFLAPLFKGKARLAELFFFQHGPHREGVGLIVDGFLYPLTHWNARAESFMIGASVLAATLLALFLKCRLFGRLSYGDAAIPMMFLTPAQYETFIGTPNAGYSAFPLLLIVLYCLALTGRPYKLRFVLCLALNFVLIYTGFGLFMGVVTISVFALECWWRLRGDSEVPLPWSLTALGIAIVSLGSFFIHYIFDPAVDCFVFPYHDLTAYPWFIALMAARFFGLGIAHSLATAAVVPGILLAGAGVVAFVSHLVRGKRFPASRLIPVVLLTFSFLFAVNTAIGRVCLGLPGAAWPSRYVTLLIPGVLGAYLCLQWVGSPRIREFLIGASILLLIPGYFFVDPQINWFADGKRAWASCYVLTESISDCDRSTHFVIYPNPERTGLREKLDYLKERGLNLYSVRK